MAEMTGCSADLNMSDVLLLKHDDGDLSEDELFLLQDLHANNKKRNPSMFMTLGVYFSKNTYNLFMRVI